jgi:hypothetical protein
MHTVPPLAGERDLADWDRTAADAAEEPATMTTKNTATAADCTTALPMSRYCQEPGRSALPGW